jgi:ADP-ribose pyrophosphatase
MEYKLLQSNSVYSGPVFEVFKDRVQYPDGRIVELDTVKHDESVTIIPVDNEKHIWFVRQYRHPIRESILELPAGVLEDGESPQECASREVREEIGMAAEEIQKVGKFYLAPGYSTEFMHVFLGEGLYRSPLVMDDDELIFVERLPVERAYRMVEGGKIVDGKSIAALTLAREFLISN